MSDFKHQSKIPPKDEITKMLKYFILDSALVFERHISLYSRELLIGIYRFLYLFETLSIS